MGGNDNLQMLNQRLDSWKEIAAFFKCDERTLRRWEKERGLPIHRAPGGAGGKVFAYTEELSAWLAGSSNSGSSNARGAAPRPAEGAPPESESESPRLFIVHEHSEASPVVAPVPDIQRLKIWPWVVTVALAGAGAASVLLYRSTRDTAIAVLPFSNQAGDAATDYLSDGITETLIDNLTHIPKLRVRSRSSAFHYKGKGLDVRQIGGELGVSMLVTGRIVPSGDTIEVNAQLTDVADNSEIWAQHYRGKSADIVVLQQQIAGDIAQKLRAQLSPAEKQQVTRQGTQNPEAYELYLKGRYAWNKRTLPYLNTAISYFNQAIAKDPGYALAYSGLADSYSVMPNFGGNPNESFPKSNAAARKALELDATLAHPHAVLGVNETQYDWDFAGGEAEFKKALELDPNDATVHQWHAEAMDRIGGRQEEAIAEIQRAHQLDPLSPVISRVVGGVFVTARQYDRAIAVCQKLAQDEPTFAIAHDCLAQAYWPKHMYAQVIDEWKITGQLNGSPVDMAFADALEQGFRSAGWHGALTRAIDIREAQARHGSASPVLLAGMYAELGDKDRAFEWLDTAYRQHDWLLIGLNTNYILDPLHSDPRFTELAHKIGLPQ